MKVTVVARILEVIILLIVPVKTIVFTGIQRGLFLNSCQHDTLVHARELLSNFESLHIFEVGVQLADCGIIIVRKVEEVIDFIHLCLLRIIDVRKTISRLQNMIKLHAERIHLILLLLFLNIRIHQAAGHLL